MTKQEWYRQADEYQDLMRELADPDDPMYQILERKRDACWANAAEAPEES